MDIIEIAGIPGVVLIRFFSSSVISEFSRSGGMGGILGGCCGCTLVREERTIRASGVTPRVLNDVATPLRQTAPLPPLSQFRPPLASMAEASSSKAPAVVEAKKPVAADADDIEKLLAQEESAFQRDFEVSMSGGGHLVG